MFTCLESKTIVICLKLNAKLRFRGFISVFGTFKHKTWYTTLFVTYYCFEIDRIQKSSHSL